MYRRTNSEQRDREDHGDDGINQAQPELAPHLGADLGIAGEPAEDLGRPPGPLARLHQPAADARGASPLGGDRLVERMPPGSASATPRLSIRRSRPRGSSAPGPEGPTPAAAPPGSTPRSARSAARRPATTVARLAARVLRPWTRASRFIGLVDRSEVQNGRRPAHSGIASSLSRVVNGRNRHRPKIKVAESPMTRATRSAGRPGSSPPGAAARLR